MLAVTNSDSDSIDADSDSMDDIDELIRRKRLKMTTPPATSSETPHVPSSSVRELRSSIRCGKPSVVKSKLLQPPRKKYKFSLASLVASHNKDTRAVQKIQEYEEEYKQEMDATARLAIELRQPPNMDAGEFVAQLQAGDTDDEQKERVLRAIQRNDILERTVQYPFFRHADPRAHLPKAFPATSTFREDWVTLLQDPNVRTEAFRTGFVADMALVSALPDEVTRWILVELLQDVEANLANGYVRALENSFGNKPFTTDSMLKHFLLRAGREDLEPDVFSDSTSMPPPANQRPYVDGTHVKVKWASLLLTRLANR
jgi:hypothetical protein